MDWTQSTKIKVLHKCKVVVGINRKIGSFVFFNLSYHGRNNSSNLGLFREDIRTSPRQKDKRIPFNFHICPLKKRENDMLSLPIVTTDQLHERWISVEEISNFSSNFYFLYLDFT